MSDPVRYIQVVVPRAVNRVFTYRCPPRWVSLAQQGCRVRVPLGRQRVTGWIVEVWDSLPPEVEADRVRDLEEILDPFPVVSPSMLDLSRWLSRYYLHPWGMVLKTLLPGSTRLRRLRLPRQEGGPQETPSPPPPLTLDQKKALEPILQALEAGVSQVFLLHGVTGSGKTEVYLQAAARTRALQRGVLILVPEIALTAQGVERLRARFPRGTVLFHSGLSPGERAEAWLAVQRGEAEMVLGTRSAVFAPFPRLGLIVLDEEHDPSYKQEEGLRYHAREVALYRAQREGAVVILGSATPSLESYEQALRGRYVYLHLPHRIDHRPLPRVEVVDLRRQRSQKSSGFRKPSFPRDHWARGLFSPRLAEALEGCLARGEQCLLFLNRRGFYPLLLCVTCGQVPMCPHCSLSLAYHQQVHRLQCHGCGYHIPPPETCSTCGGVDFRAMGVGTEQVEAWVRAHFPKARVLRMDRDTTRRKYAHQEILAQVKTGEVDVLIGTQMISKGLDFPRVTLVGIILADTGLHLPDFRASERTFQILTQVAGRAGRGERPGRVILQTFNPLHPAVVRAVTQDYAAFAVEELRIREELGYPPFRRLARILVQGPRLSRVEHRALEVAQVLQRTLSPEAEILGPAPTPVAKLRGRYRWQVLVKFAEDVPDLDRLRQALEILAARPVSGVREEVDLDPQSLL